MFENKFESEFSENRKPELTKFIKNLKLNRIKFEVYALYTLTNSNNQNICGEIDWCSNKSILKNDLYFLYF